MAQMLEFAVNMSMLFSGNYDSRLTKAGQLADNLSKKITALQNTAGKSSKFDALQKRITQNQAAMIALRKAASQSTNETERAQFTRKADSLQKTLDKDRESLSRLRKELQESGVDTGKLTQEQGRLQSQLEQSQKAQARLTEAQSRYQQLMGRLSWGSMKSDVLSSAALLKTFQAPVTVSMNYEQAMSKVKAVANPNEEEYAKLRAQSLELGRTTQFSAIQAANSQENLSRASFKINQILAMMPEVMNVAAADGMDLALAADILGGSLRGFNLDAKEAQRISDILAYTSANSATNVTMAGAALQGISGTARLQKMSPEIAASYIGVLANRANLQGTEAATTLERSISAIAMRKGDTAKILDKYKIATVTGKGRMVRLDEIVTQLYDKTIKRGETAVQNAFMRVFGKAYGGDMLKFEAGVRSGELAELLEGLKYKKTGSALAMAETRNDNLAGDLTSLSSAWEGFMESVGNPLQDWSRSIVQAATNLLNKVTSLAKEFPYITEAVTKIAAGFAAWKIGSTVFSYAKLLYQLPQAWAELKLAQRAADALTLSNNLGDAAESAGLLHMSLGNILGVIGLIALASYEIVTHWKEITQWAENAGRAVTSIDTGKISAAKAGTLSRSDADYGLSVMNMTYAPGEIPQHAKGGIMTHPHIGLVAEKGPEAIIPLRDKSRGLSVLNTAMNILGVTSPVSNNSQSQLSTVNRISQSQNSVSRITDSISQQKFSVAGTNSQQNFSSNAADFMDKISAQRRIYDNGRYINDSSISSVDSGSTSQHIAPVINITLNSQGGDDMSIAQRIKQAVIEAMNELSSREERLSFA